MARENTSLVKFNQGKISKQALARTDLDRTRLSAEIQTNYIPKVLGPMILRPGLGYIGSTYQNKKAFHIPFIASTTDTALLELTDMNMRIRINDTVLSRTAVSTTTVNGNFGTDISGWTDADQAGATSQWVTGGYMSLQGTGFNAAIRQQTLNVGAIDQNVEHGLRVVVTRGIVSVKIGSSSGDNDLLADTTLYPGTHSLAFTPTGVSAYLEISSRTKYASYVDSINIDSGGDVVIPTIWPESALFSIRNTQSIDVIFCACFGYRPQRIERHGPRSWSVVDYRHDDGPYRTVNTTGTTMAPGALTGDTTLTASQRYFKSTNVGSLFAVESLGQTVTSTLNGEGQYTDFIRVIGVGTSRNFTITVTGTWSGTLTVQRSITDDSSPADTTTTYTGNTSTVYNDGLDNQIVYYRVGFNTGDYTSGSAVVTLTYDSGSVTGIGLVTEYISATQVNISVLKDFGGTSASSTWSEGLWSDRRGFPSAVALYEGRLWWTGKGTVVGSVSDAYDSFDPDTEGDSAPINRTIGEGPVDNINFMLPLQRLILGGQGAEFTIRSSAFDEIITPANFNIKTISTQGSDGAAALKIDSFGVFPQQGGTKVFELVYNSDIFDYEVGELTTLVPEQCQAMITKMAVQRKPDTRVHCILQDGTVGMLVYDRAETVIAWVDITSEGADGFIEDVVVLPGTLEDTVYYTVKRTIGGNTVRYLEKWAREDEITVENGSTDLNKQADSFIVYDSTATTNITGLSHLEGESVVVWADGVYKGAHTVSGGAITLATAASRVVVGLDFTARFKSAKLAYADQGGTALNMHKRVPRLGLIMLNTHKTGVRYGPDFDHLYALPKVEGGTNRGDNYIWAEYDEPTLPLAGGWSTDSRLCLESKALKPCTILCCTITVETNG